MEDQIKVADEPGLIVAGETEMVAVGRDGGGGGGKVIVLSTVTITAEEFTTFPAASRATAIKVWVPLVAVVVSQAVE